MMPAKAEAVSEGRLIKILAILIFRASSNRFGFWAKISTVAERGPQVPIGIRPIPEPRTHGGLFPADVPGIPRSGARGKRRIFELGGVIELTEVPKNRRATGVAWAPNHR